MGGGVPITMADNRMTVIEGRGGGGWMKDILQYLENIKLQGSIL